MNKKTEKEYQDEIRSLNFLLLEQNDHIKAIGRESDKYKSLLEQILKLESIEEMQEFINRLKQQTYNDLIDFAQLHE